MKLSEVFFILVSFLFLNARAIQIESQIDTNVAIQKTIDQLSSRIETLSRAELIRLAKAYSEDKQYLFAIKTLNVGISKNPRDFEIITLKGEQEYNADKIPESLSSLKEALEINSKYEPAYLILIQIYEKRKNRYELRLAFQDMVEKIGEKQLYLEKLCEITTLDGLYDLSLEYCRKGVLKFPKSDIFQNFLGITLMETGKLIEADGVFKKSASKFPKSKIIHITQADYLLKRKDYVLAYSSFLKATQADPTNYDAFSGLGRTAVEIQKYRESIEAFKSACELKKAAAIEIRKIMSQLKIQKKSEFEKDFKKLLSECTR